MIRNTYIFSQQHYNLYFPCTLASEMKEETIEKGRQGAEWKRPCWEGDQRHKKWGKMFGGKLEEVGRRAGRGDQ
jgi:hypothetical protein